MFRRAITRCAMALCAGAVVTSFASADAQERVSPDEFLDFALGQTLTFETFPGGTLVGVEEFLRRDLSVWRDRSDRCVYGQITVDANEICFLYDDDSDGKPVCWATFRADGTWFVLGVSDGVSQIQKVTHVTRDELQCPTKPGV